MLRVVRGASRYVAPADPLRLRSGCFAKLDGVSALLVPYGLATRYWRNFDAPSPHIRDDVRERVSLYVQKAERKDRTKGEVDQVICWLTGYDESGLQQQIEEKNDFETFFAEAPAIHPNSSLIKGVVCGVRVEEIQDPLMQEEFAIWTSWLMSSREGRRWRRFCVNEYSQLAVRFGPPRALTSRSMGPGMRGDFGAGVV